MINEKYFLKNNQYTLDEFEFKNGRVLKDVNVDYGIVGNPKYDGEGNIINAIIFCHGFEGNYSSISDYHNLISLDAVFSKEDYFFISITSLGFPESCSPSTTGLNQDFPDYVVEDLVNFKRQFLREKFPNIKKIHGIIGCAFGGYEALAWSIFYPDDVEFIVHYASSYKTTGYKYIFAKMANQIIESSPNYYGDYYDESMSKVLISLSQIHYLSSFTEEYLNKLSVNEIELMMESFTEDGLFYDVYDIKIRNDFLIGYDLEDKLDQIKCKVLIIAIDDTSYYTPDYDAIPLHNVLKDSKLILLDVDERLNEMENIHKIRGDIEEFLDSL